MTKEEIIQGLFKGDSRAIKEAIKALEQPTSDDYVSRKEVIDELNHLGRNAFKDDTDYDNFFAFVDSVPPVTPTQKWIFVSEKLPEEGKEVLAYYEYFRYGDYNCMQTTYGVGYQYDGLWCGDIRGHKLNVIAWQPLPEAYKEK